LVGTRRQYVGGSGDGAGRPREVRAVEETMYGRGAVSTEWKVECVHVAKGAILAKLLARDLAREAFCGDPVVVEGRLAFPVAVVVPLEGGGVARSAMCVTGNARGAAVCGGLQVGLRAAWAGQ
jgi:hypothetical protein